MQKIEESNDISSPETRDKKRKSITSKSLNKYKMSLNPQDYSHIVNNEYKQIFSKD